MEDSTVEIDRLLPASGEKISSARVRDGGHETVGLGGLSQPVHPNYLLV